MPSNVIAAFTQFMDQQVNLDPAVTALARASGEWLLKQVGMLPQIHADFPVLYQDAHIHYGSFDRRTKIRELDDLDMIVGLSALGTVYSECGRVIQLTVPEGIALRGLCHEGSNQLNSRRVINKFLKHLSDVPQYHKADLSRDGSAGVLDLKSYTWSFDIVPGFLTSPEMDGRTYYVIPNGEGHWMKTDPRLDRDRVTSINQLHDGHVLNAIRLIKYWNNRPTMPSIPGYLLECIVLGYYERTMRKATQYVDIEAGPILTHIANAVLGSVEDPKGIQGELNSMSWSERSLISARASQDATRVAAARQAENADDHKTSIGIWQQVLGSAFPPFT